MTVDHIALLPIEKLASLLARKKISPRELVETFLERIERGNPKLNAYLTVTADEARRQAALAEREIARGNYRGLLHGIPISLKDNIWTRGVRTTAGSKVLADFIPREDATVARKLQRAGAILLGKTNLHEFAYGITTNNPHYGPTRNPWDTERIPGGSSGGSAAAVAVGLCAASVGTDTGGSIRIPAALCGIVGLKPTFGRVSCYGVVPLAKSLDHVGPLTRSVADAAILLGVLAGRDPRDESASRQPVLDYFGLHRRAPRKLRLGWPREYFLEKLDKEVLQAVTRARKCFEELGVSVQEISLPHLTDSVEPSTHIAFAEALRAHEALGYWPARKDDYSEELRKRLRAGEDVRAVDYLRAFEKQKTVRQDFETAFEQVDAILAPTVPITAPPIGTETVRIGGEEETVRSALIRLNRPANFTGLPAISLPCGLSTSGLPIGLQIIGPAFCEAALLGIARLYEETNPLQSPAGF